MVAIHSSLSPSASSSSTLFKPFNLGPNVALSHRIIMAPMTRLRSSDSHIPLNPMMSTYYSQRASYPGTLIISEGTLISPRGAGVANAPGIWNASQIAAWREVTTAVHAQGSYIICQLAAIGRPADPALLAEEEGGPYPVVSSSAIPMPPDPLRPQGGATPKPLTAPEIRQFVADFAAAAHNAVAEAGFDGVEIHAAQGYLVDQFTQDACNDRTDGYGGSVANRSRFALEVARAVLDAVGGDKAVVGFRISPWSRHQGMRMAQPETQFRHLLHNLAEAGVSYIHAVEPRVAGNVDLGVEQRGRDSNHFIFDVWPATRPVLLAGGFGPASAREAVDQEYSERQVGIVFGRHFLANPDLPFRILKGLELNEYHRPTFYKAKSSEGYIDYPFSEEFDRRDAEDLGARP